MAAEKAATYLQRKQPSWRATMAINGLPTKLLRRRSAALPLWVAAGLLFGLFASGILWRGVTAHQNPPRFFPGPRSRHRHHWHKPFELPDFAWLLPIRHQ